MPEREENDLDDFDETGLTAGWKWNERYQQLVDVYNNGFVHSTINLDEGRVISIRRIRSLALDFVLCAQTYGKIIIAEKELPDEKRTIRVAPDFAGVAGGDKYVIHDIVFKFALDKAGVFGYRTSAAMKVAGHDLKGLNCYFNTKISEIRLPLMCLVDYRGYRLLALSKLPLGDRASTLILGSSNAGERKSTVKYEIEQGASELNELLKRAGKTMNLSKHLIGSEAKPSWSAMDIEGHIGQDNRFYLLDFSRTMPPVMHDEPRGLGSHVFELFRPEFVKDYQKSLCPDGPFPHFIPCDMNGPKYCKRLKEATRYLCDTTIPNFVTRFLIKQVQEAVANRSVDSYRLPQAMHRHGINLRYLGLVLKAISDSEIACRSVVIVEALARSAKRRLRAVLRAQTKKLKVPLESPYRVVVLKFFNRLFGISAQHQTDEAPSLFKQIMERAAQYFGVSWNEAESSCPNLYALLNRSELRGSLKFFQLLMESTGVQFTPRGVRRFSDFDFRMRVRTSEDHGMSTQLQLRKPFDDADLIEVGERVKQTVLVAEAEAEEVMIQGTLHKDNVERWYWFGSAIQKYQRALDQAPSSASLWKNLASSKTYLLQLVKFRFGEPCTSLKDTARDFRRAMELDPSDPEAPYNYARLLNSHNKQDKAEALFLFVLEKNIWFPPTYQRYSNFLIREKKIKHATDSKMGHEFQKIFSSILTVYERLHNNFGWSTDRIGQFAVSCGLRLKLEKNKQ